MKTLLYFLVVLLSGLPSFAANRPNIVVILCDDLGYGDLSCYGHKIIRTPNLDALASGGILYTDGYAAAPVCSPSRAGMLTGRDPHRSGVYDWLAGGVEHLRESEVTFAKLLKQAGYDTMIAGKWHLNGQFNKPGKQPTPERQGFDHWYLTHNNARPNHKNPINFVRNGKAVGETTGYSSSLVVEETLSWLNDRSDSTRPFLSVLTFHEPHTPIASPADLVEQYLPHETLKGQAVYWANVGQVDRAVGELIKGLKNQGLYENTLIVFTSDNGPEEWMRYSGCKEQHGEVGPLRGHKLDVFEGGIRVPFIVSWPAIIKKGRVSKQAVSSLDLLPTFCKLGKVSVPNGLTLDGCDISANIINDEKVDRASPLFWFYSSARGYASFAMRDGDYSIIAGRRGKRFYPGGPVSHEERYPIIKSSTPRWHELYRISEDLLQVNDLKNEEKKIYKEMSQRLNERWEEIKEDLVNWGSTTEKK
jgi:arylsulfatase A